MVRKILVLNLGSTSFKFKLYNMGGEETLLASVPMLSTPPEAKRVSSPPML